MKLFKNLYKKYFGETKYHVRVLTVDGSIIPLMFDNLNEVDKFVKEINTDYGYEMITNVEKIQHIPFKYNKEIIHGKLHFRAEPDTEMVNVDGYDYSYPKIEENLTNVIRK